jgi:hypothetical protein
MVPALPACPLLASLSNGREDRQIASIRSFYVLDSLSNDRCTHGPYGSSCVLARQDRYRPFGRKGLWEGDRDDPAGYEI